MRAVFTIALKDLRLIWRDKMALFWTLGFPLIMSLFFGAIMGGGGSRGKLEIAVEDQDRSDASARFVDRLKQSDALVVTMRDTSAREQVRRGKLVAHVLILRGGDLELAVDPARKAEAGALMGILSTASFDGPIPGARRMSHVSVLPDKARPASAFEITFPLGIVWGVIGCVATFAISMVVERTRGTMARLRNAPISRAQILAGKATACFLACFVVIALLLVLARLFFGVRLANPAGLALAAVCTALCFVGITMFFSVLGKTESAVAGSTWGIMMPFCMIGGAMIPLIAMPRWMQTVSHASPVKWAILSLEGGIWRGLTIAELILPCAILVAIGALFFTAGATIVSRKEA